MRTSQIFYRKKRGKTSRYTNRRQKNIWQLKITQACRMKTQKCWRLVQTDVKKFLRRVLLLNSHMLSSFEKKNKIKFQFSIIRESKNQVYITLFWNKIFLLSCGLQPAVYVMLLSKKKYTKYLKIIYIKAFTIEKRSIRSRHLRIV